MTRRSSSFRAGLERPGATPAPVVDTEIRNAQPVRIIDDDPFRLSQLTDMVGKRLSFRHFRGYDPTSPCRRVPLLRTPAGPGPWGGIT